MSKTPPSQGKGSSRRREDARKVRDNWDAIRWARPAPKKSLDKKP